MDQHSKRISNASLVRSQICLWQTLHFSASLHYRMSEIAQYIDVIMSHFFHCVLSLKRKNGRYYCYIAVIVCSVSLLAAILL